MKRIIATLSFALATLTFAPAIAHAQAPVKKKVTLGTLISNFPKMFVSFSRIGTDALEYGSGKVYSVAQKIDAASDEYVEGQSGVAAEIVKQQLKEQHKAAKKAAKLAAKQAKAHPVITTAPYQPNRTH